MNRLQALQIFVFVFGCLFPIVGWSEGRVDEFSVVLRDAKPIRGGLRANGIRSLKAIVNRATKEEWSDLQRLLSQIELKAIKQNKNGRTLYSVVRVERGSVYDREGLKFGDLVWQ